jgi:predicted acylesterase/phospholipase RssA
MTIKHLVLSGGGPTGIFTYGAASQLAKKDFWCLANIKSIYGCSIGAYMAVVFSLGYDWEWLDDYFIKRPWEKLVGTATIHFTDIYEKKSLINETFIQEAILPLLRGKDLSETITLKELYDYNTIDIHMYTTNINTSRLTKVDLSHESHPNLSVIKALQMSMAFPIIFEPICEDEDCFIDGGVLNNFPLNDCLRHEQCAPDEILAFKNIWKNKQQQVKTTSNIFDFLMVLMKKMQASLDTEDEQEEKEVKYIVRCIIEDLTDFDKWAEALASEEMRKSIVENSKEQADLFFSGLEEATI